MIEQRIILREVDFSHYADLVILEKRDGKSYVGRLTFEECDESSYLEEPTYRIREPRKSGSLLLRELSEDLWAIGARPSMAQGSRGQLDAVKYHLEDMRSLVFGEAPQ